MKPMPDLEENFKFGATRNGANAKVVEVLFVSALEPPKVGLSEMRVTACRRISDCHFSSARVLTRASRPRAGRARSASLAMILSATSPTRSAKEQCIDDNLVAPYLRTGASLSYTDLGVTHI
jgi:hypothetical protein